MKELALAGEIFALLRRIHIAPASFAVPIALSLAAAAFEGLGMGLLIPMLQGFLVRDFSFIQETPGLAQLVAILPPWIPRTDRGLFALLLVLFSLTILFKNILRYGAVVSMQYLALRSMHHLRKTLFSRYLTFGKLYFDRTNVGHHATVLSEFTKMALRPLLTIDKYLHAAFSLIGYLVVMSLISWRLTLFAIPLFLLLHLAMRGIIMAIHRYSRAIAESLSALGKKVVEILSTMPLVLAMGTQDLERHRYKAISAQHAHLAYRSHATEELVRPLQEFLTLLSMLALFTIMLYLLVIRGESTASSFLVYFYLVFNAAGKFGTLTGFRSSLAVASAPLHEVLEVFNDRDKERVPEGSVEFSSLRERIDVRHLHFRYQEREEVLQDVSFTAERGTVTALVGATGAGKTTFIHLLLRFYDCPPGTILLDGRDIRSFTIQSLRAHMALVSQETLLLNDTLRNNLSYGVGEVPAKHLHAVLERARLTDFVSKLPHGLETRIGDRGVKLSGGEKQRVAIARALLRDADILLLDEATSALDSRTERLIQEAIDEAIQGKTAFVIAHRLSTIRHADRIIVLDGGRCVEQGTLEELLERKGTFYAFWEEQRFW